MRTVLGYQEQLKARNYSLRTRKAYIGWVRNFRGFIAPKPLAHARLQDVKEYVLYMSQGLKVSAGTQAQILSALQLFIEGGTQ